jgi:3-deoxy-D-manno-octulosonate 8-phosphate phosphatase (KDO 8-P phosphatase)
MSLLKLFQPITTFAFDMDGVLTDGSVILMENGAQVRKMNIKDGYALQLAIKKGYHIVVLSGSVSGPAKIRLEKLGVRAVFMGVENKEKALDDYLTTNKLSWSEVLYMGDDVPDHGVMAASGLACAPSDAVPEIRYIAKYISPFKGGEGCVRDVIEKVMKLKGHWDLDITVPSR